MKQRAKVYKGKRVVMGDKNRVTKHEIHVNDIPQQGGESGGSNSGGGGGTASSVEYLDLREYQGADFYLTLTILADIVNAYDADNNTYCGVNRDAIRSVFGVSNATKITYNAVGVDFLRKIKANVQGQIMDMSIIDLVVMSGTNKEDIDAIPRLTEEEFYTLN